MDMKMMSSSWWIRPCSRRGSANSVKSSRSEAGSWRVGEDVVSKLTVMAWTSLRRLCDPDDRYYRRHAVPGQPVCTEEASQAYPERRAFLSWCVSPGQRGDPIDYQEDLEGRRTHDETPG